MHHNPIRRKSKLTFLISSRFFFHSFSLLPSHTHTLCAPKHAPLPFRFVIFFSHFFFFIQIVVAFAFTKSLPIKYEQNSPEMPTANHFSNLFRCIHFQFYSHPFPFLLFFSFYRVRLYVCERLYFFLRLFVYKIQEPNRTKKKKKLYSRDGSIEFGKTNKVQRIFFLLFCSRAKRDPNAATFV